MAVFESPSLIEKRVLECSNIRVSGIRCEMEQPYRIFILEIKNFYQLKNDVAYFAPMIHQNGTFFFTKKRNHHRMQIVADGLKTVTASILYGKEKTSNTFKADGDGVYLILMPSSVVENEQNTLLKKGRLLIHIGLTGSDNTLIRSHDCSGKREKCCVERISRDLNFVHTYPNATDILLYAEGKIIPIPKGLLKCRSNYFKENPDSDNNIDLNTNYETASYAVKYLYTGTLSGIQETRREISNLLKVALLLKINSLMSKCLFLLNNLIIREDISRYVSGTLSNHKYFHIHLNKS